MKVVEKIYSGGQVDFEDGSTEDFFEMDGEGIYYYYKSNERHYFTLGDEIPEEDSRLREKNYSIYIILKLMLVLIYLI